YGDLTGKGQEGDRRAVRGRAVHLWRRSYDVPPPRLAEGDPRGAASDPRYRDVPAEFSPRAPSA
ncbi:phosphoglyceromutase, partial [mine drainage metagenome]